MIERPDGNLTMSKDEFRAYQIGMAQRRPVHIITMFDGINNIEVERHYPIGLLEHIDMLCKHCRIPGRDYYPMEEKFYGKNAVLCKNCEQISYRKV